MKLIIEDERRTKCILINYLDVKHVSRHWCKWHMWAPAYTHLYLYPKIVKNLLKCIEKFEFFSTLDSVENHKVITPKYTAHTWTCPLYIYISKMMPSHNNMIKNYAIYIEKWNTINATNCVIISHIHFSFRIIKPIYLSVFVFVRLCALKVLGDEMKRSSYWTNNACM
jgi:hypothetical protein